MINIFASSWIQKYLWIIILVVLLSLIFAFTFLLFLLSHKRQKKQVKDLRIKLSNVHELLTVDCHNMLTRIEFISKRNSRYLHSFENYEITYNNTLDSLDLPCDQLVGSLEALINEKAFKDLKSRIENAREKINDYEKVVKSFNEELAEVLKPDDECRYNSLSVKEDLRKIKEMVDAKSTELKGLESSFNSIFKGIDDKLYKFEEYVDSAEYEKADSVVVELKGIINELNKMMEFIPLNNTLIRAVIPNRIVDLTKTYEKLNAENYPLHHMHFNSSMEKINEKLNWMKDNLAHFVITGIKETIDSIFETLDGFDSDFQKEIDAKIKFEKERENTTDDTYMLEKTFAKLTRKLPSYSQIYVINDSYLQQIKLIKEDINRMSAIKRDLDSFIHSSTKQPYSILLKKMIDLQQEMNKIHKTLDDFHSYLHSLKETTEKIYSSIETDYILLKENEYAVRTLNVPTLTDQLELSFDQAYESLNQENAMLTNVPINVNKLVEEYNQNRAFIDKLIQEIAEQITLAKRGEESIVHGNRLRKAYAEVNKYLIIAEKSFFEADFARATDEAINIIKKMRPDISNS